MNELLWFSMLVASLTMVLVFYKLFGKVGLFVWIPIGTIVANIQVIKIVELFGFQTTLGNIVYASLFLATDILSENHGPKDARKGVAIGFLTLVSLTGLMNLALWFQPGTADSAHGSLAEIFTMMPRLALASALAYCLSQTHDVAAYQFWKKRVPGIRAIWLRNNASTVVSQLLDTVVFTFVAFAGLFPWPVILEILWTTYVLKLLVAVLDTPFIYLARMGRDRGWIPAD
ncbi:MAG: queuosine precursor transporter [Lentisphaeria bacterium]|nr:queuosine precursor transporter [Lentisphaeria bacterium]